MKHFIIVDVESDGPIPGPNEYSMVCLGAVALTKPGIITDSFYGQTKPISEHYIPEALAISGFTREEHLTFEDPKDVMERFAKWVKDKGSCIFISDNLAYDWSFINWYLHKYTGSNPFGFSGQRIGDKFQGFFNDPYFKWKKFRKTKHTHNPVDDAKGNAEALIYLQEQGYKLF